MSAKPPLLDLYCGGGGATRGYQLAGFEVTGVDIKPQPNYCGDHFVQEDALAYLAANGHRYVAIHASPPCQAYSSTRNMPNARTDHVRVVELVREALIRTGVPYVIENVPGAKLHATVMLCGQMFGLKVFRHRYFETSFMMLQPPHHKHTEHIATRGSGLFPLYQNDSSRVMCIAGKAFNTTLGRAAMGIDWPLNQYETAQAIPPAYTTWIGGALMQYLEVRRAD